MNSPATQRNAGSEPHLLRRLTFLDTLMLCVGGVIGSAIFLVPHDIANQLGSPLPFLAVWLVGGFISHLLNKRSERTDGDAGRRIRERGVIIASGLMAGGALGGVIGAALRLLPKYREDLITTPFFANEPVSQTVSAIMFLALCMYVWFGALKKEKA